MDQRRRRGRQPSSSTKVERRIIERNRRNQMKELFSNLNSLIPNYNPKEVLPLPDQIDKAINYIKGLETKVKITKIKKQGLLRKRSRGCSFSSSALKTKGSLISPKIEIHELGSSLEVVLTCGFDNQFIFNEIIRILHDDNIEVVKVNSSLAGDSMINFVHAKIPPSFYQFGATKVSDRLKSFVHESVSDVETQPELSDFGIDNEMWDLPDLVAECQRFRQPWSISTQTASLSRASTLKRQLNSKLQDLLAPRDLIYSFNQTNMSSCLYLYVHTS